MVIQQGDIWWAQLSTPVGSEPGEYRPIVVVQSNLFNRSRINTAVVCAVTSNLRWSRSPGNVTLAKGEGGLPKRSVVNVSHVVTVDETRLIEKIGTLSMRRLREVLEGVALVLSPP